MVVGTQTANRTANRITKPPARNKPPGVVEALGKLRGAVQKEQKEEKEIAEKVWGGGGRDGLGSDC